MTAGLAGAAAAALPAPAVARSARLWRMATSWPKNSPGPGMSAARLAERITLMSGGALRVEVFAAGDLLPPLEVFDGVAGGSVEMGHSAAFFWRGKLPASVFFTAVPFGLTPEEHAAWITQGGGQALWDELYGAAGVKPFMAGNSGLQMGGWFTREIASLTDLQGLKFRIPGLGGEVYRRLGATPVVVPPGEIFAALQSGLVDGAEFLGPWSDAAFGFYKVAPYYYWPGFHEPNGTGECLVNQAAFDALAPDLQAIVAAACATENAFALAESDWQNAQRLKWLVAEKSVQLRAFPSDVITRARAETAVVLDDLAARDPMTAKVLPSYRAALGSARRWSRVGRGAYLSARDG